MSALDDLVKRAHELFLGGSVPTYEAAALAVAEANPVLAQLAAVESLTKILNKAGRRDCLYPKRYDQLVLDIEGKQLQIPDRTVRLLDEEGKEQFAPRRFVTTLMAQESLHWVIQTHQAEVRRAERDHTIEVKVEAELEAAGIDTTKTHDEIKHATTICWRCGEGYHGPNDPFQRGHRIAVAVGGGDSEINVDWEHESCNRAARANP